jgi:CDP-glucose 4,6-dehydratase
MENLVIMRSVDSNFWKGKRVFLTGHTGFKGGWLAIWLSEMGAKIKGYSLAPNTSPNLFEVSNVFSNIQSDIGDIRDFNSLIESIKSFDPEIIFHLAAQPLVRDSYNDPLSTFETNVIGTANLLQASRNVFSLKSVVIVTTDKCYENREWEWGYRENEALGGYDPYSSSKGCAELVTSAFRRSFFLSTRVAIASARAGNVIGGGDWSKDRLIPDILRSYNVGEQVVIRFPKSSRPWQHVLDPLAGYLMLAEDLYIKGQSFAQPFNFGPMDNECITVEEMLKIIDKNWPKNPGWRLDLDCNPHEAQSLKLDISKAVTMLGWKPRLNVERAIQFIVDWNNAYINNSDMRTFTLKQINNYICQT